jgi:hypothetical protein
MPYQPAAELEVEGEKGQCLKTAEQLPGPWRQCFLSSSDSMQRTPTVSLLFGVRLPACIAGNCLADLAATWRSQRRSEDDCIGLFELES